MKLGTSAALICLSLLVLVSAVASQPPTAREQPLVIEGRVLWVDFGSETMIVAPDAGPAISIDLRRLPQSDYHGFRGTEYVRVVGYIFRPSRRIQAHALYLVTPWFPASPEGP